MRLGSNYAANPVLVAQFDRLITTDTRCHIFLIGKETKSSNLTLESAIFIYRQRNVLKLAATTASAITYRATEIIMTLLKVSTDTLSWFAVAVTIALATWRVLHSTWCMSLTITAWLTLHRPTTLAPFDFGCVANQTYDPRSPNRCGQATARKSLLDFALRKNRIACRSASRACTRLPVGSYIFQFFNLSSLHVRLASVGVCT